MQDFIIRGALEIRTPASSQRLVGDDGNDEDDDNGI